MASAYGWRKKWILEEVYFDELFDLLEKIKKRKINDYMMQLAIVQNPHIEDADSRRALWDKLERMLDGEDDFDENADLDRSGMERLKMALSENPRIRVK